MKLKFDRIKNTNCLECNRFNGTLFSMFIDTPELKIPLSIPYSTRLSHFPYEHLSFVRFHYKCLNNLINKRINIIKNYSKKIKPNERKLFLSVLTKLKEHIKNHKTEIEAELSILSLK